MTLISLLFACLLPTAAAEEAADSAVADAGTPELEDAEPLGYLTPNKVDFLKPKRHRLPQNPYQNTDFTAYSLEFGEWRVGLASVSVGLAPRVQLGTAPALDAIGVYNANLKVNILRAGPVDLAVGGAHYNLPLEGFSGTWTQGSATLSTRILKPWSLHVTGSYVDLKAEGTPQLGELGSMILVVAMGDSLADAPAQVRAQAEAEAQRATPNIDADASAATVRVATDIRLNRRDSIILQGQAMVYGQYNADVGTDLPPMFGLDEALDAAQESESPILETYVASVAYQMNWKRLQLRVGAGVSSVPGAWLLQSTDLAWRFGGETKQSERRMRRAWRHDKRGLRRGPGDALAAAPVLPPADDTAPESP